METHIGHLHSRYRVHSGNRSAVAVAADLDGVARSRLPEALAGALARMLGDDSALYVIRTVQARVRLAVRGDTSMQQLAERWALQLARSVAEEIAEGDGSNVVRFRNEAEFIAKFLADLVRGEAWDRWYYGAFARLRRHGNKEALRAVLADQRGQLSDVLGELNRVGSLDSVLTALGPAGREDLWRGDLGAGGGPADPNALRPLFAAVIRLVGRLGLWIDPRPADEALYQAYMDDDPPSADWRDPESLAAVVFDAVRFLAETGRLTKSLDTDLEALTPRLRAAVAGLDWLDRDQLVTSLLPLRGSSVPRTDRAVLRSRPVHPTPKHRALLADLETVCSAQRPELPAEAAAIASVALRLYGALVAAFPRWAGDPLAVSIIDRVVRGWFSAVCTAVPITVRSVNRDGDAVVPATEPVIADRPIRLPHSMLSEPEQELVQWLAAVASAATAIASNCAGVFLLLRPILDLRLPPLLETIEGLGGEATPPSVSALSTLAVRWAGVDTAEGDTLDLALAWFAGLTIPLRPLDLVEAWSTVKTDDLHRCQHVLFRSLAGQRMLEFSHLHLFGITDQTETSLLVAADATAGFWPLGCAIEGLEHASEIARGWLTLWQDVSGMHPTVVLGEELTQLGNNLLRYGAKVEVVAAPMDDHAPPDSLHWRGRKALGTALATIGGGRIGRPGADLFLDLVALSVLRVWSRWMKGFSRSAVPYLLDTFIRRPGRIAIEDAVIEIELPRRGLDLVVEMAGYLEEHEPVSWLGGRRVRYRLVS